MRVSHHNAQEQAVPVTDGCAKTGVLVLQAVNTIFWLFPNILVVAASCAWFDRVVGSAPPIGLQLALYDFERIALSPVPSLAALTDSMCFATRR